MERDLSIDNVKGWLILLVIIGHVAEIGGGINDLINARWQAIIYTFHMPLFVILTGYLSNPVSNKRWSNIINLVIVYVIFQTISCILSENVSFFKPFFALWYIVATIWWRIMLIIAHQVGINRMVIFIISLLFCLFGGLLSCGTILAADRTFNFFPFFVMGNIMREHIINININRNRLVKIVSFLGFFIISFFVIYNRNYEDLMFRIGLGHYSICMTDIFNIHSMTSLVCTKIGWLLVCGLCSACFFYCIPQVKKIIQIGYNSIDYYIYHPFILFAFWKFVKHVELEYSGFMSIIAFALCIILIKLMTYSNFFCMLTRPYSFIRKK